MEPELISVSKETYSKIKAINDEFQRGYEQGKRDAVVHAYWQGLEYDGYADGFPVYDLWECSACGNEVKKESAYCCDCGAQMDAN